MKKILLLNPPGKKLYLRDQYCSSSAKAAYYWPAIDLLVLSGILRQRHDISVCDAIAEKKREKAVLDYFKNKKFDCVISLASAASMREDFQLLRRFKEINERVVIVANAGFLRHASHRYLAECYFLDAIITDYTQDGILGFLAGEKNNLRGIRLRIDNDVFPENDAENEKTFAYPLPHHELFPLNKYFIPQAKNSPFSCSIISFGCKFGCRFCSSSTIPFKKRNIANFIEEIKYLKAMGINEVHFPDFTFTSDKKHTQDVCKALLDEKLNIGWDCLTRADSFDEELALLMKNSGCHTIQFGVETKNEKTLKEMAKPVDNASTRRAFRICRSLGIETIGFFIIGLPGDDKKAVTETISFAKELDCDYASFSLFVPDSGSPLREELEKKMPFLKNIYEFDRTKYPVFGNDFLSRKEIWKLKKMAIRRFYFRWQYFLKQLSGINNFKVFKSRLKAFISLLRAQFASN